jgi:hypothetical protein
MMYRQCATWIGSVYAVYLHAAGYTEKRDDVSANGGYGEEDGVSANGRYREEGVVSGNGGYREGDKRS